MDEDIIEIKGKKYTHRSGFPKKGELVYDVDRGPIEWIYNVTVGPRIILTPVRESGPWENEGKSYETSNPNSSFVSPTVITDGANIRGIKINSLVLTDFMMESFMLDAVKQAKAMGIIKEYEV